MIKILTRIFRRPPPEAIVDAVRPVDNKSIHPTDREKLRAWLRDPVTLLALGIVQSQRPSIVSVGFAGTVEERRYNKETRLTQLQGWDSFRNTLLAVGHTPEEIKALIAETYPDQAN